MLVRRPSVRTEQVTQGGRIVHNAGRAGPLGASAHRADEVGIRCQSRAMTHTGVLGSVWWEPGAGGLTWPAISLLDQTGTCDGSATLTWPRGADPLDGADLRG